MESGPIRMTRGASRKRRLQNVADDMGRTTLNVTGDLATAAMVSAGEPADSDAGVDLASTRLQGGFQPADPRPIKFPGRTIPDGGLKPALQKAPLSRGSFLLRVTRITSRSP